MRRRVGNLEQERGSHHINQAPRGPSRGIATWSAGHVGPRPRRQPASAYAPGPMPTTPDVQLVYLVRARNVSDLCVRHLRAAPTLRLAQVFAGTFRGVRLRKLPVCNPAAAGHLCKTCSPPRATSHSERRRVTSDRRLRCEDHPRRRFHGDARAQDGASTADYRRTTPPPARTTRDGRHDGPTATVPTIDATTICSYPMQAPPPPPPTPPPPPPPPPCRHPRHRSAHRPADARADGRHAAERHPRPPSADYSGRFAPFRRRHHGIGGGVERRDGTRSRTSRGPATTNPVVPLLHAPRGGSGPGIITTSRLGHRDTRAHERCVPYVRDDSRFSLSPRAPAEGGASADAPAQRSKTPRALPDFWRLAAPGEPPRPGLGVETYSRVGFRPAAVRRSTAS